jgi:hypothetical protein
MSGNSGWKVLLAGGMVDARMAVSNEAEATGKLQTEGKLLATLKARNEAGRMRSGRCCDFARSSLSSIKGQRLLAISLCLRYSIGLGARIVISSSVVSHPRSD